MPNIKKPKPQAARPMEALSATMHAYWRGEMPLWGAFWVYGMGFGTLVGLMFTMLALVIWQSFSLSVAMNDIVSTALMAYVLLVMYGFWLTYYTWHIVGVWRCGKHASPLARSASRVFVGAVTLTYWPIHTLTIWIKFL